MPVRLLALFGISLLTLCPLAAPADAAACPPGMSAGACLDKALAAIDDLERRVAQLERGGGSSKGANDGKPNCTGGQVVQGGQCVCPNGLVSTPMGCRPKNAP
jgi:hypothetical protein